MGCNGGISYGAFAYYQSEKTIALESDYPYTAANEYCMLDGKPASGVEVTKWNLITSLDGSQIKAALAQSPIAAVVNGHCYAF